MYKNRAIFQSVPEKQKFTVLVAPLDWGLGHATRCIPLIKHLLQLGCKIIIATEGKQEKLLKTEFPSLLFVKLPGYGITYTTNKRFFSIKIIAQLPKILKAVKNERKWLNDFLDNNKVEAIISDNRYGLYRSDLPSVFITHQLLIKGPFAFAERIMQKINYSMIRKFSECWVPDEKGNINLAGALSHPRLLPKLPVHFIGGISRLELQEDVQKKYDVLIVISGPEPQRTLLEHKVLKEIEKFTGKILLVRGLPGDLEELASTNQVTIINHLPAKKLEDAFNASEFIISRSGYTTVMDICKLQKKSVLIPTPGQTEQEYLAKHLQEQGWCLSVRQENFSLHEMLERARSFQYKIPKLNMEEYKAVLTGFVNNRISSKR
ncbi:MAG: glycosyltransferase [Segetibacter sp.]|nr:glycosyltransferase [Segetibacter sp.]